jgi:hypothetical protein
VGTDDRSQGVTSTVLSSPPQGSDDAWLEALLRAAVPLPLCDDGFSAAVLARATTAPATLSPAAALAAARRDEERSRRQRRWTTAGALVGAVVAVGAGLGTGPAASTGPAAELAPVVALLVISTVLGWLAIARS